MRRSPEVTREHDVHGATVGSCLPYYSRGRELPPSSITAADGLNVDPEEVASNEYMEYYVYSCIVYIYICITVDNSQLYDTVH